MGSTDTDVDARSRSRIRDWFARYWILIALLVTAVVVAIVVRHVVYPALSWNRDESTYLWQVRGLDAGQLLTTTGGLPKFFQPWLTGITDGQFSELVSGDIKVGQQVVTAITLPQAARSSTGGNSLFGGQQPGRGNPGGMQPGNFGGGPGGGGAGGGGRGGGGGGGGRGGN